MKLKITPLEIKLIRIHCDMPLSESVTPIDIEEQLQISLTTLGVNNEQKLFNARFRVDYHYLINGESTPNTIAKMDSEYAVLFAIETEEGIDLEALVDNQDCLRLLLKSAEPAIQIKIISFLEQNKILSRLFLQSIEENL